MIQNRVTQKIEKAQDASEKSFENFDSENNSKIVLERIFIQQNGLKGLKWDNDQAVTEWLESELADKNSHISHLISRYENSKLLSDLSLLCQNQEADDIAEVFQNILDQCSKTKQKTILNILNSVE